ncbi:MAG: hypothetical protein Q9226_000086 [Calogaya cf. arnoldii]
MLVNEKPEEGREVMLKLPDIVGKPDTVELPDIVGKPEESREEVLKLPDTVGKPETVELLVIVGKPETVELLVIVGKPEEGREVILELKDAVGMPEEASEVLRFPAGYVENPELGRIVKLAFAEGIGRPELAPVIVGRRVVALAETVGVRLGTIEVVKLKVEAMVGRVPDEANVFERVSEALELGKGGETLEPREPTMLEPVPMADVTTGAVKFGAAVVAAAASLLFKLGLKMVEKTVTAGTVVMAVRVA